MKTLKQLLEKSNGYEPKPKDEKRFVDKHVVVKHPDANGNGDDVFNATNVKEVDREKEGHGYKTGQDEAVYESKKTLGTILEKKLTPAEMKKREEVAKAIERENPNMPMGKKMAIATSTAKKVAEEVELDEKLTDDAKKKIQTALGPRVASSAMRKTSGPARAMIGLAKTNPANIVKEEDTIVEFLNDFYTQLDEENQKVFEELAQEQDLEQLLAMVDDVLNGEADGSDKANIV